MVATTSEVLFQFTADNVIQYGADQNISFKDIYKSVTEEISSTSYAFTINYGSTTFRFTKNTDGSLAFESMTLIKKTE